MRHKFQIAIPELPIDRSKLPQQIFEECDLLEGDKNIRGDNSQLLQVIDQVDAIIFNSSNDINAELMQSAPKLKIAFKSGARPENIDYTYAKSHGIAVGWTPAAKCGRVYDPSDDVRITKYHPSGKNFGSGRMAKSMRIRS